MPARTELLLVGRRLLSRSACPSGATALRPAPTPTSAGPPLAPAAARPYRDVPRPARPDGNHLADLARAGGPTRLHELIHSRHRQLGGMFVENIQGTEVVFVAESGMIRDVLHRDSACPQFLVPPAWAVFNQLHGCQRGLFFMTGSRWQHHRRIMNRYMLRPSPHRHAAAFNHVISGLLDRWHDKFGGRVTHTEDELYIFSVEIMAAVLFGENFGWVAGRPTAATDTRRFADLMRQIFATSVALSTMDAAAAARDAAPEWRSFETAVQQGLDVCRSYVEEKIVDLEGQLAAGQPAAGIIAEILQNGEDITREDIVRVVADLFLAAGDTTAHSTQWALYQLGREPAIQQRLLAEIRQVAPAGSPFLSAAQIDRVPFVKAIVKETLRMYPVAPFLTRLIQADTVIGGFNIPAGTPLCVSLYTSSRDERYFPDPLSFRPERWLRPARCPVGGAAAPAEGSVHDENGRQHRHACMPFASGVRGCIGKRVAELQMQLLLARLVHRSRLAVENERPASFLMRMVGVMSDELRLRLLPREE